MNGFGPSYFVVEVIPNLGAPNRYLRRGKLVDYDEATRYTRAKGVQAAQRYVDGNPSALVVAVWLDSDFYAGEFAYMRDNRKGFAMVSFAPEKL